PAGVVAPGDAGDAHPPDLVGDHVGVADHEPGDGGQGLGQPQPVQPAEQLGHRGGGGQDGRGGHPEGALDDDVPGRPEPADGPRHAKDLDPLTLPDDREEHREQQERQLDDQAPGQGAERDPAPPGQGQQPEGVHPEGPERLAWGGHDGEDEQQGGGDLALGPGMVQRARPRKVERVGVTGPHGQGARVGSDRSWPERMARSRANRVSPTPKVTSTPISPESPVPRRSLLTPLTAYPARGPFSNRCSLALAAKPWSSATLLS